MMATPHMHVYRRNDTEQQSEASLCNNGLLFCMKALAITKVSSLHAGADEKLACQTEGFSTADLELDNCTCGASLTSLLRVRL